MFLVALFALCSTLPALAAPDPYVDLYYPNGFSNTGFNQRFVVETNCYKFSYDLQRGMGESLINKLTPSPVEMWSGSGTGSMVPQMWVNGSLYSSVFNNDNHKAIVVKAGKNFWEVVVYGITLRTSAGTLLPGVNVAHRMMFWPDKFFVTTAFGASATVSGIQAVEMCTYWNPTIYNRYNTASVGDQNLPGSGSITANGLERAYTFFNSTAGSAGSVVHQLTEQSGTEYIYYAIGPYGYAGDSRIFGFQRIYDQGNHNYQPTTWYNGYAAAIYSSYYMSSANTSTDCVNDTQAEIYPLGPSNFTVSNSSPAGTSYGGYDTTRGHYVVNLATDPSITDYYFTNQNNYLTNLITTINDTRPRKIRLNTNVVGTGYMVTGTMSMLTDTSGRPTGNPVQTSKKWDGPGPQFIQTFSLWDLPASTTKSFYHKTAIQKWGTKRLVGLPSLSLEEYGNWGTLWLETNVGLSESVCYNPDDTGQATICDFRAINGNYHDPSVPGMWYANAGGAEFFKCNYSGSWRPAIRREPGIRFLQQGPNVSQFQMVLRTKDGAPNVKSTVTTTLLPSEVGTRVFYKVRHDFLSAASFSNIKRDLALFTMQDRRYGSIVAGNLAYLNSGGTVSTLAVNRGSSGWQVTGTALNATRPWVALYNPGTTPATNNVGFVVHSFSGRFKGVTMNNLCYSLYRTSTVNEVVLGPNTATNSVNAGDYAEMVIELYTWHPSWGNYSPLQTERSNWPTTAVANQGTKIADFPVDVAQSGNVADCTVTGGTDHLPLRFSGFTSLVTPILEYWNGSTWVAINQTVNGNDAWQTDFDPVTSTYAYTFTVPSTGGSVRYRCRY